MTTTDIVEVAVVPDRDQFRRLPGGWRQAARALAAVGRGSAVAIDHDQLRQGFACDLAAGVATLPATLRLFQQLHEQPPLGPEIAIDQLARATRGVPRDRNDSLLHDEAERQIMGRNYDPQALLERFLRRSLRHNVIDSKGGVAQALRIDGHSVDADRLLAASAPTIQAVARELHRRPNLRRLRMNTPQAPIDMNANLLGAW